MYCQRLQFPFEIETPGFPGNTIPYSSYDHTQLDPRLLSFLKDVNLYVTWAEVFYSPPFTRVPIHIDAPNLKHYTKLNICYSSPFSVMNWYNAKPEFEKKDFKVHELERPYIEYSLNEVNLEHTERTDGVYLINASIPHDSTNFAEIPRYTLSLGLNDSKISEELSIEEAVNRLKSVVV